MTSTLTRLGATAAASLAVFAFATPAAQAAPTGGANGGCPGGTFCSSGDTSKPSENGNGGGNAFGRPTAGSVGNADDKNPPGQSDGDANKGYECDENSGIGKTNPAHTGCEEDTYNPPT